MWLGVSPRKLHNPLAQVGIDNFNALFDQERVEVDFLGEHALAFDDPRYGRDRAASFRMIALCSAASAAQWTVAPSRVALVSNCSR